MDEWSDDDDDDWFYSSIKRYNILLMFDFSLPVKYIEFIDVNIIGVIFEEENGHNEISCLSLPKKLTVSKEQEGLEKNSDFQVLSGGFTQKPLIHVKALHGISTVLASEKDQCGLSVYKVPSENSGIIQHVHTIKSELVTPNLTYNKVDSIAMVDTNKDNIALLDTQEFVVKGNIKSENKNDGKVCPEFLSLSSLGLCDTGTGITTIYDIRSSKKCNLFNMDPSFQKAQWTLSSSFLSTSHIADNTDDTKLGLLSTSGVICIYDIRNPQRPLSCEKGKDLCSRSSRRCKPKIQFSPLNFCVFSVSGFDSNIYIYDFSSNNIKNVFVHDGHHRNSSQSDNITTDQVWFKDTVISACDNLSVHCWNYIVEK